MFNAYAFDDDYFPNGLSVRGYEADDEFLYAREADFDQFDVLEARDVNELSARELKDLYIRDLDAVEALYRREILRRAPKMDAAKAAAILRVSTNTRYDILSMSD